MNGAAAGRSSERRLSRDAVGGSKGCAILVYLALAVQSFAGGLSWERMAVEEAPKPEDKEMRAVFAFTNTGSQPVKIRSMVTSCGCTIADGERRTYQPGEKGVITGIFAFGGRKGMQEKAIIVSTDEPNGGRYVLMLRARLPDSFEASKDHLSWQIGDPLEFQEFEISVKDPEKTKIIGVKPLDKAFEAVLEEVEPLRKYRVKVRPVSTQRAVFSSIGLELADPQNRKVYLRVQVAE